jgi:tetratricopeptide (TPR) repeat protein/predicted Ser/Thr protein kinase
MSEPDDDKTRTYVALTTGTMVSHYRIIEKIGAGGMGEVYLAEDTKLDRKVALKFLPQHLCQSADCRARFTREAQATAKLSHPNIVTIFEVSDFNGRPFFAMEHVEGLTLKDVIAGKPLPMDRIIEIGIQVCEGLQAAHEKGITHRDIKPSNILIDSHGRARIVDFGLASVLGTDQLTKTGSTLGTIGYMSPEQVRGDKVDNRTDLFSFGVVLYEMITGHSPFKADSEAATLHAITNTKPDLLARYRREVPAEVQTIIDKALEKDTATRYQHADDMVADLKRLTNSNKSVAKSGNRTRLLALISFLVVVLVVAVLVFRPWNMFVKAPDGAAAAAKRVVVVPFKNQTGDPSLDPLGRMVADWATQSLMQTEIAEVVPPEALSTLDAGKGIQSLIDATTATLLVIGSYYKIRDSIQFQAQVFDAKGKLLIAVEPVYASSASVMNGIEEVRQRVLVALASELDSRAQERWSLGSRIPNYAAYQEFLRGEDLFDKKKDFAASIDAFMKGYVLDTFFMLPLVHASYAQLDLGQYDKLDTLLRFIGQRRASLGRLELLALDELNALLTGRVADGLDAMRQAGKLAPRSTHAYDWGLLALWSNRPRECIEAYNGLEKANQSDWYWWNLADAYHRLGDHKKELEIAQEGRQHFPASSSTYSAELSALAALDRQTELRSLIQEQPAIKGKDAPSSRSARRSAAEELRAHGHEEEAMKLLNEALRLYESLPVDSLKDLRFGYSLTLYDARRWDKAKDVLQELLSETSKDSASGRGYEGWLGIVAARQGDRTRAMEVSDWLKNLKVPYQFGGNTYTRACIAAILGEKDQAIALLKQAFLEGYRFDSSIHRDFDFESLWDYPLFIELMKPKG